MATKQTIKAPTDLKALDQKALADKAAELRKTLVEMQQSLAAQELPNPSAIRKTRREIAKVLTALNEKRLTKEEEK